MRLRAAGLPLLFILTTLFAPLAAEAQQAGKKYRVGVVLEGGPYYSMIDGMKDGLKDLGFEEGTQYILHIRDVKGEPKAGLTIPPSLLGRADEVIQ